VKFELQVFWDVMLSHWMISSMHLKSSQHLFRVLDPEDEGNGKLMVHTDSHASDSGAVWREGRTILGAKSKNCTVKQLYLGNRSE
jgi:hypothetical protein